MENIKLFDFQKGGEFEMFTDAETAAVMALIHAVIVYQVSGDDPREYETATSLLQEAAGALDQTLIEKLVATVNMKTARIAG